VERELNTIEGRHDTNSKVGEAAKKVVKIQDELTKRSEPILKELSEQLRERQSMLSALRFLSPAILVQISLEDIAGSGSVRHDLFETQADAFHKTYRQFFSGRIQAGQNMTTADLEKLPAFVFQEEPVWDLAKRTLTSILALLLASCFLVVLARPGLEKVGRLAR
jgi:ABC-2 type transport system permease protein